MERGYLVSPRSRESIRGVAQQWLDALGMRGRHVPIMHVLETVLPFTDERFSVEVLDSDEMLSRFRLNAEGMTVHRENLIALRADVYEGACTGVGRDRFTAAHELGHYLLHRGEGMAFPRKSMPDTKPYLDSEWQANTFAREFLADLRYCGALSGVQEISSHFGVSASVAEIQWNASKKMAPQRDHRM